MPLEAARELADIARIDAVLQPHPEKNEHPAPAASGSSRVSLKVRLRRPLKAASRRKATADSGNLSAPPPDSLPPIRLVYVPRRRAPIAAAPRQTAPAIPRDLERAARVEPPVQAGSQGIAAESIPLLPWWPDSMQLLRGGALSEFFQDAPNVQPPPGLQPAVALPGSLEPTRPAKRARPGDLQRYGMAILLTSLLIFIWVLAYFAPQQREVVVQSMSWTVSVPIEEVQEVYDRLAPQGEAGDTVIDGRWVQVDTARASGQGKEVFLPKIDLSNPRFRPGAPVWVFIVTFTDRQGQTYPEVYSEQTWRGMQVGQSFLANVKGGRILRLEPIQQADSP